MLNPTGEREEDSGGRGTLSELWPLTWLPFKASTFFLLFSSLSLVKWGLWLVGLGDLLRGRRNSKWEEEEGKGEGDISGPVHIQTINCIFG